VGSTPATWAWQRCPSSHVGRDVGATAQHPRGGGHGPLEPAVAPVFCRRSAGSGRVLPGVARCQATPNRRRARRIASSLTHGGVSPWAKLLAAASASVPRRVGWPNVRGRWGQRARRDAPAPASTMLDRVGGRDAGGGSAARPRG
jgi:hypothetical protein